MIATISAIGSLIVAVLVLLWTVYRDSSSDNTVLESRINGVETKVALMKQSLVALEQEQDQMKSTLKNLENGLHELDLKIERILTILDTKK
ncbi:hypothetical protein ACA373_00140 [Erwinia sp. STN24]|uniref:hypothetical protein n=1 Tax=Erwinia sp. STN24 TaxID=3233996 RepID=UPI0035225160